MSLDERARDVWADVSQQVATVERPSAGVIARRSRRGRVATGLATLAALALAGVGLAVALQDDPAPNRLQVTHDPEPTTLVPAANGWVAQTFSSIWLVTAGETGEDDDLLVDGTGMQACPAFSPDGERLMYGRYAEGDASLEVVTVAADGTVSPLTTIPLEGVESIPCAIWAPDGRWAALGGSGAVRVVDTETAEVRLLRDYAPTDLEWRPGTDELAITGQAGLGGFVGENAPIDIYTVSTGDIRTLDDVEAVELTWSPDGTTIAYTQAVPEAANTKSGITLIDADGTNPRPLTTDGYVADHGIGVVWSPRGDQIAYQRVRTDCTGAACYEQSEVVLVTATDTDPDNPIGTERAIPPLSDDLDLRTEPWYTNSVTWSPDGTKLLYSARVVGTLSVPVDLARPARVLDDDGFIGWNDDLATTPWLPLQQWQPIP